MRKVYLKGAALALAAILACPGICGIRAFGDDMTDVDVIEDLDGFEEDEDFVEGTVTEVGELEVGNVGSTDEAEDEWSEDTGEWVEDEDDFDDEEDEDDEDWGDGDDTDDEDWGDGDDTDDEDWDDGDDTDDEDWGDDTDDTDDEDWGDDTDDTDDEDWDDGDDTDDEDWDDSDDDSDSYTVIFMDGDDVISEQEVQSGEYAEAPDIEKEGYDLQWDEDFDEVTEDLTVSAVWVAKEYTVSFNANGGKTSKSSIKVTYGQKYGKLPTATRDGYKFTGWFTKKKNGKKVTASTVLKTASKQTLYAGWKKSGKADVKLSKPVVTKVSGLKKKISVTVKKDSNVAGYEVQYSVKKNFAGAKTANITVKKGTKIISGLKAKTKYYVRVRSYVKTDGKKVYSKYSKVINISTLK